MLSLRVGLTQAPGSTVRSVRSLIARAGLSPNPSGYYLLSDALWWSLLRNPVSWRRTLTLSMREASRLWPEPPGEGRSARHLASQASGRVARRDSLESLLLYWQVRTLRVDVQSDDAIGGEARLTLRGDGTYEFSGHMRATGLLSYEYILDVFMECEGGTVIMMQHHGRVYGSDTPGPRQNEWRQSGNCALIRLLWPRIRTTGSLRYHLETDLAGVIATVGDVGLFAVKAAVAYASAGQTGLTVIVSSELTSRLPESITPNAGWLADFTIVGTTVLLIGSNFAVPVWVAAAAGATGLALAAAVKSRRIRDDEIAFARRVFQDALPYRRIVLTNMSGFGGRAFVYPASDGSILLNLGDVFDQDPMRYVDTERLAYGEPGSLFIHELTHVWQIARDPARRFLPLWACEGATSSDYYYFRNNDRFTRASEGQRLAKLAEMHAARHEDTDWPRKEWSRDFNIEQQASIVDDWFGEHGHGELSPGLQLPAALNDPAFRFISEHIRAKKD